MYTRRLIDSQKVEATDSTSMVPTTYESQQSHIDQSSTVTTLFDIGEDEFPLVCSFDEFFNLITRTFRSVTRH